MINIKDSKVYCVDVETTGLRWTTDRVFGVAVAVPDSLPDLLLDPLSAPVRSEYFDVRREPQRYDNLRDQMNHTTSKLVNHNVKFDLHMLRNDKIAPNLHHVACTTIRACLIDEHLPAYNLDYLAKKYLKMQKVDTIYEDLARMFGGRATRNVQMLNLHRAPPSLVERYAKIDAELALRLWAWQETEITKQGLQQVCDLESELFPHIFIMERTGIRVDTELAERQADLITATVKQKQQELNKIAGFEVNPNPSQSIIRLFKPFWDEIAERWIAVGGTPLESTEGGKPCINADALRAIKHPAAGLILQIRKMSKTADTFIRGHILGYAHNGRVHPNINQTKGDEGGTGTGRLSYTAPALQQVPSRDKQIASIVRPIFLPEEGHGWTYGDLDQHELRIFHHYVNSPEIIKAYRENPDLDGHQIVADLTGLPRNPQASGGGNAKQVNLAMVFNMGAGELASQLGLPYTVDSFTDARGNVHQYKRAGPEALEIMERYYEVVPGVREIASKARSIARSRGYVRTMFGRHIRFPRGEFVHKASGLVYQGTAADLNKDNIIKVSEYLRAECPGATVLLNIHDEISLSLPRDGNERKHCREMQHLIQNRPQIRVPLRIDFSELCDNWWEATQAKSIT